MFLMLISVLVILLVIYIKHITSDRTRTLNKLPGPKPYPFIGNVLEMSREPDVIFQTVRKNAKTYSTFRFWNLMEATVNIVTPDDAEQYFTHLRNLEKTLVYDFISPWLGSGILTANGDATWKKRRKMLTPTFHFSILKVFFETMVEHSEQLVKELKGECSKDKTDIAPIIGDTALKIICETSMGTKLKMEDAKHRAYMDAAYEMCEHVMYRISSPWFYNDTLFKLSSVCKKMEDCVKTLHDFTDKVVKERERTFVDFDINDEAKTYQEDDVGNKRRHVMLDLLIKEKRNGNIDDQGIREEVNTFMFAGHDTSATTITFSLLLIANHKEVQDKIYKEIIDVLGDRSKKITMNDLQEMQYLEMCLKECLRYYPPIPVIARRLHEDLQVGAVNIPAETEVMCHIYDIHHNPKHWPDPEKFDPDRFLPENIKERHPFAFVPFSAGPRNCIGQKFGMLEVKCVLASILREYEVLPVTRIEDMNLMLHIVLKNKGPIYVKFTKRQ